MNLQMLLVDAGFKITDVEELSSFFFRFFSFLEVGEVGCSAGLSSVEGGGVVDIWCSFFFGVTTFHFSVGG